MAALFAFRERLKRLERLESMIVETSKREHVANPAAAQPPKSPKTKAFEGVVMYYGYRYYDPMTGRWPSRDPIGERGGVNLYGFVYNNPFGWIDVLGREPRPNGSVACAGCHGTADGSWSNIAGGDEPGNIFQEVMPPANPPALYGGITVGAGVTGGATVVSCCDENDDFNIFFYTKICRSGFGAGVTVGAGHVTNFEGSKCRIENYEGPFIEFGVSYGVGPAFDLGTDFSGNPTGVNDVGGSVGTGFTFAICFYKRVGSAIKIPGGCSSCRTGDDGLAEPLPNAAPSDPYTMDDFFR